MRLKVYYKNGVSERTERAHSLQYDQKKGELTYWPLNADGSAGNMVRLKEVIWIDATIAP